MPVDAADRALLVDDASPRRDDRRRARARPRRAPPPGQPRLRRAPEDGLRARTARRRRRDRDGPRRQPVRPGAGGGDGRADPGRRGRHRDRLAAARRPRDRGRDAALEVGRQPAADRRSRTARSASRFSEYHTGYRAFSAPTSCARSRSCATPTTSSSTRRSSPRCSRAARACVEIPIPTRYFHEASSVDFVTSLRYALQDAVGARALPAHLAAAGPCCAVPPHGVADRPARGLFGVAAAAILVGRVAIRVAYVARDPGLQSSSTTRSTTTATRSRSRRARLRARLRPPDRVPPARLPVLARRRVLAAGVARRGRRPSA